MINYKGAGSRLVSSDLQQAAKYLNVSIEAVKTVVEVETNGRGFDDMGHPKFLFEPHRFYAELKGRTDLLKIATQQGLAYKAWKGPGSYPKSVAARWAQYQNACMIDEHSAIRSASWGLGQIMGSEYIEAGYSSPEAMVESFAHSEGEQLMGMAHLIKARGLDADMRKFPQLSACEHFALRYNGSGYKKNNYHIKLRDAFRRHQVATLAKAPGVPEDGVLRVGSYGERVLALQKLLIDKGYTMVGKADKKFGINTRDAVNAWKSDNQRTLDGQMDAQDIQDLENGPSRPVSLERATTTAADLKPESGIVQTTSWAKKVGGIALGSVGLSEGANQADMLDQAQNYADKAEQASGIYATLKSILINSGIGDIMHFIVQYRFTILVVVVLVGLFAYNRIEKMRVEMHRKAEVA